MGRRMQKGKLTTINAESGFSLIELAILMVIIGLLIVPALHVYNLEQISLRMEKTRDSLSYVRDSLVKFAIENGRYPVPADRNLSIDNVNAGAEHDFVGTPFVNCTGAGGDVLACRAGGVSLIGDVPFRALGINTNHIVDGYKGKITYAILESLTNTGTFVEQLPDNAGLNVTRRDNGWAENTRGNVHFVVISHGDDNSGAFSLYGASMGGCLSGGAANRDTLNCNHADATFTRNSEVLGTVSLGVLSRSQYLSSGGNHYDDYIGFTTSTRGDKWSYSVGAVNMESRNTGNALIGALPSAVITGGGPRWDGAVAKLEVVGDVRTDVLTTDRICPTNVNPKVTAVGGVATTCPAPIANVALVGVDAPEQNVFDPSVIASATDVGDYGLRAGGIRCDRQAMGGIQNSDETCVGVLPATFVGALPAACPAGTFPKGIKANGDFECILP